MSGPWRTAQSSDASQSRATASTVDSDTDPALTPPTPHALLLGPTTGWAAHHGCAWRPAHLPRLADRSRSESHRRGESGARTSRVSIQENATDCAVSRPGRLMARSTRSGWSFDLGITKSTGGRAKEIVHGEHCLYQIVLAQREVVARRPHLEGRVVDLHAEAVERRVEQGPSPAAVDSATRTVPGPR